MPDVTLTPGVLPQPQCYSDEQARFEAYVAAIITSLTGGLQWTASNTAPTDLTQYWLKTDTSNPGDPTYARGLELLKWSVPDAAWVRVFSVPTSTGVIGGAGNSFTLTHTPPYITIGSAYRVGQIYVFISNQDITGAATLNIDGLGAKPIKKRVSEDLDANDILTDQMVSVIYDGTNFQMLSAVSITPSRATQFLTYESGLEPIPASGSSVTFSHNLGVKPWSVRAVLVRTATYPETFTYADGAGSVTVNEGDEIEIWKFWDGNRGAENESFRPVFGEISNETDTTIEAWYPGSTGSNGTIAWSTTWTVMNPNGVLATGIDPDGYRLKVYVTALNPDFNP